MSSKDPESSTPARVSRAGEAEAIVEFMLNGMAYCRMLYEDGRPSDFVMLYVNPAFESLTGFVDVVDKRITEVPLPGIRESNPELFDIFGRVASGGRPEQFEILVATLGMWFSISVYSPRPDHFVAMFDVINLVDLRAGEPDAQAVTGQHFSTGSRKMLTGKTLVVPHDDRARIVSNRDLVASLTVPDSRRPEVERARAALAAP